MSTITKFTSPRSYDDFQAPYRWVQEESSDVLRISLPGFKKDQIKVQTDNLGKLRVTGERPLAGNRWSRFREDFHIPANCNTSEIYAKFDDGVLDIVMPRLGAKPVQPYKPTPVQEPMLGPKTVQPYKPTPVQEPMPGPKTVQPYKPTTVQEPMPGPKPADSGTRQESMQPVDTRAKEKRSTSGIGANVGESENGDRRGSEPVKEDVRTDDGDRRGPGKPAKPAVSLTFKKPDQLMVNAAVAVLVLIAFSVFLTYRLTKSMGAECKCN